MRDSEVLCLILLNKGFFTTWIDDLCQQIFRDLVIPISCGCVGIISISCGINIYQLWSNKRLQSNADKERSKPKRPVFLSKYTSTLGEGLKCIGKIYIQEIARDYRQLMIPRACHKWSLSPC